MEKFFCDEGVRNKLLRGLFGVYLNFIAQRLVEEGYTRESIRTQIKVIGAFGTWLKRTDVRLEQITPGHAQKFLRYHRSKHPKTGSESSSLRRLLELLRHEGIVEEWVSAADTPQEQLLENYVVCLKEERNLAACTVTNYRKIANRFMAETFDSKTFDLSGLSAIDVIDFVRRYASAHLGQSKNMISALRSFLRYLCYQDHVKIDLATAVPAVAQWSMTSIPKALPREQVELVLRSCDRQSAIGCRDYAILLLLARLGIRAGEVMSLKLADIDWEAGKITVHGKTHRPLQLPLSQEVGKAIADYLCKGRQKTVSKFVFLRARAPMKNFRGPAAVSTIVMRALERTGIVTPRKGAHQFRHGLATEMLRQGASLSEIGEMLGHRKPDTTAIYAKVDLSALRSLALPWPGGEQ